MNSFDWEYLESIAALRSSAGPWDDLWQRSDATLPTGRAEFVAQWLEFFAPGAALQTVVVRDRQRMIAACPSLARVGGLRVGHLPGNAWSTAGELLLDPQADVQAACDQLVAGLRNLRWPLVVLGGVATRSAAWQQLAAALERQGLPTIVRERFRVPRVEIDGDWSDYLAGRSANHRRHIRRSLAKARQSGALELKIFDQFSSDELAACLRRGFEIEDRSWKGTTASSVLQAPGLFDFYLAQAGQLAARGNLRLVFLEHDGKPVAFEYGWLSKGVYFTPKVGYDEASGHFSPGQLLRAALLEQYFGEPGVRCVDYLGPASRATSAWSTGDYPVARVLVATRPLGRWALSAYRRLHPVLARLRHSCSLNERPTAPQLVPGAAPVPA